MPVLEATTTAAVLDNINSLAATLNGGQPTWDILIILFFLLASFIYGLSLGRDRIIVILMSIYMALVVMETAPFLKHLDPAQFGINNAFVLRIIVFLVIFVFILFLISKSALLAGIARSDAPGRWWQIILFSLLHVGLLISITLSFLPPETHSQLAPLTKQMFIGEQTKFFWIIAPIIALALSREHRGIK